MHNTDIALVSTRRLVRMDLQALQDYVQLTVVLAYEDRRATFKLRVGKHELCTLDSILASLLLTQAFEMTPTQWTQRTGTRSADEFQRCKRMSVTLAALLGRDRFVQLVRRFDSLPLGTAKPTRLLN